MIIVEWAPKPHSNHSGPWITWGGCWYGALLGPVQLRVELRASFIPNHIPGLSGIRSGPIRVQVSLIYGFLCKGYSGFRLEFRV